MTRIEKLRTKLPAGFSAALVQDDYNRAYLTHFHSSAGLLLVTQEDAFLIVDFRYIEAARRHAIGVQVVLMDKALEQVSELLKQKNIKTLWIEDSISLSASARLRAALPGISIEDGDTLTKQIHALRAIKDAGEIAAIRAAQAITDKAFTHILTYIESGMTERQVAAELEYFMRQNGADGTAFSTICVSGVKSSMPHGVPDENIIQKGDLLTMDYGAIKDGYCSDMTRTVAVGSISDEQRRLYDTVLEAHMAAEHAAKAGIRGSELDKVARDLIYAAGYEGCFGHGLGHSLGLEIHEEPRASLTCDEILPEGTVVTIEPGIYLEGRFGARIENMVVLTAEGCEVLTNSERALIIL